MNPVILLMAACFLCFASNSRAEVIQMLKTPRGADVQVIVHNSDTSSGSVMVIAPGRSCNAKSQLFETIGNLAPDLGITAVRFEWAYCLSDPQHPSPSQGGKNEIEDMQTVITFAKSLQKVDTPRLALVGKSMGSVIAYRVFAKDPSVKALALLTPLCLSVSDCDNMYPSLKKESRPILMTMGDKDSDNCSIPALFDFLKDDSGDIWISIAGGDHGFGIAAATGTLTTDKTQRNIKAVVTSLLNWADIKLNP